MGVNAEYMGIHASNAAANSSSFLRTRVLGLLPCVLFKVKMFGGPMCGVASNSMRREQQRYFNRMADSLRRRHELVCPSVKFHQVLGITERTRLSLGSPEAFARTLWIITSFDSSLYVPFFVWFLQVFFRNSFAKKNCFLCVFPSLFSSLSSNLLLVGKLVDSRLDFRAEVSNQTLHRPRCGISEGTDGVTFDLLRDFVQHINLLDPCVTHSHLFHHGEEPRSPFSARGALSTRLVLVEIRQSANGLDNVGALVHDDDGRGTKTRLHLPQGIEIHEHIVADVFWKQRHRGAAWDDRKQVVPSSDNPAAVLVNELPERNTHFFFHRAGPVDVTTDAKELGSDVVRPSEGREPLWTSAKNCWRDGDRLHVRHGRWAPVEPNSCWERWLQPWLSCLSFQALNERGLLSANVSPGTVVHVEVVVVAASAGVLSDEPGLVGFGHRPFECQPLVHVLSSDINITCPM